MIEAAGIVLVALTLLVLVQALFLLAQVLASLPKRSRTEQLRNGPRPLVAVIIPAHNESTSIASTIGVIVPQLTNQDRLVVVADNCSDDTAAVAALSGAEVIVRRDYDHIGKGYALDYGVQFIRRTGAPDVVIFIDADCELAPGSVDELAEMSFVHFRPVQSTNLVKASTASGKSARIAEFAFKLNCYVRPLGSRRLGLACRLTGTGMAFPWSIISSVELATGHIAEDGKLCVNLAIAGFETLFCPTAKVTSVFPEALRETRLQRMRWEHGHLQTIKTYVPRLFLNACRKKRLSLAALALDFSVPPLGLLNMIAVVLIGIASLLAIAGFPAWIVYLTASTFCVFCLAIGLAWHRYGREIVSPRELLSAPEYVLSKVPMYWRFIFHRQVGWDKSELDKQ
jgi:cellulose synthase/poly-beta-1,6-N-acetylglucosamine synthase-like glycosyltransferase